MSCMSNNAMVAPRMQCGNSPHATGGSRLSLHTSEGVKPHFSVNVQTPEHQLSDVPRVSGQYKRAGLVMQRSSSTCACND